MKHKRRLITYIIGLALLLSLLPGCVSAITYNAESIQATIVDAETGEPVEGAVVLAHWVLEGGMHVDRVGDLVVMESVTDKDGQFHFPAWGPIEHVGRSRLTDQDPEMIVFKSGYKAKVLINYGSREAMTGKDIGIRKSWWNHKTIKLKKFTGSMEKYSRSLSFVDSAIYAIVEGRPCAWEKIPRMISAAHEQAMIFKKNKIHSSLTPTNILLSGITCGNPVEYFK